MSDSTLQLAFRRQCLCIDDNGRNYWQTVVTEVRVAAAETALILCDVWDNHWSRGAQQRLTALLPRMNAVVRAARDTGATIIHAPSDTIDYYVDAPARRRVLAVPAVAPPAPIAHNDPPLPVDASDQGSDTPGDEPRPVWARQHPGIEIDQSQDIISADGTEIYSYLCARSISQTLIMGVHTNMCVLNRPFAIKQMVRWGVSIALVRDLTDTMYNPAMVPYVDHDMGTDLVVGYVEKFWCPTIQSRDLL